MSYRPIEPTPTWGDLNGKLLHAEPGPPMADGAPGRQQLSGYVMRDYEQFVATLAHSRESQGVTYAEVADRMGRTYLQQVFNWLRGGAECRARRLFALADALGYDLALIPREDA